jgi:hypothetical protein
VALSTYVGKVSLLLAHYHFLPLVDGRNLSLFTLVVFLGGVNLGVDPCQLWCCQLWCCSQGVFPWCR